ncbi:MAG: bifunctional (p)ppGpp synthetase/guanosine-3',5'-bis(diphosphate) 3'-pyrophosphohydrolase [Bacilli bacterium]|nr:bifunctional (p)ppGpp synthetase/guanosine-3',5'-bis(diphosphate) 3'-pyrophosphohydrolase [Bacilli bacterium]
MSKSGITKFEDLEIKIRKYITNEEEISKIKKAYEYAKDAHLGMLRKSGEPYIQHPLNVAYILTRVYADTPTLCAALLHDTVEDTDTTLEDITKLFDSEVSLLVNGVTKINKLNFSTTNEAIIANQRKIFVGLSEDVRVIILKLADRLHNMRTLWALSEEKQKENARETLEILTPIAHRLGIHKLKSELEDLSLRYLKPDAFYSIVENLNQTKLERDQTVQDMLKDVSDLLNEHDIKHEIKGRAKSIYSIYNKLDKGRNFNDIFDLLALRILVDTEQECYVALGLIHSKYRPIPKRFKDYIARPKTNMYQSLHTTVFGIDGFLFEIQIRTHDMNQIAEYGIASHWSYKEHSDASKSMQNDMEQKLQFFRNIIELQEENTSAEEFVNTVKSDILKSSIYVFTPKGDVIELPKGATPIDFAYKVHTEVGDKMVGAIVNNSIVPLDYELKSNDIVKINTNKTSIGPNKEWINIAKTNQAKNKIKAFFFKKDKLEYIDKGNELLKKELRKKKLVFNEILSEQNLDKILNEFKLKDIDDLYFNIGTGKYSVGHIINILTDNFKPKEEYMLDKVGNKETKNINIKNDIIVSGIDDIKINLASCCKPVKNDDIIGFITKGNGISIHRKNCHNIFDLDERLIDVRWNENITNKKYPTTITIHSEPTKNPLLDVITKASNNNINIENINTVSKSDVTVYEVTILVSDYENLDKFINDLYNLIYIKKVERIIK